MDADLTKLKQVEKTSDYADFFEDVQEQYYLLVNDEKMLARLARRGQRLKGLRE